MRASLRYSFVVLGVGTALLLNSIAARHNWRPASSPVSLNEGAPVVLTFKADQSINYDIDFEISSRDKRFDCLLGAHTYQCRESTALEAEWEVAIEGKRIASGTSRDAFGASWNGSAITKTIGTFAAKSGGDYVAVVRFTKPVTPFSNADPRVSIRGDRYALKSAHVNEGLQQMLACLVLMTGFLWLFVVKSRGAKAAVIALLNEEDENSPRSISA